MGASFCSISFVLRVVDARLGNIDLELVVSHGIVIEHADRLIGIFLCRHGHKGKALRQARALIGGNIHRGDGSGLCEQRLDFLLCGRLVQVSYINSSFYIIPAFSGCAGNKNDRNPINGSAAKGTTEIQLFITYSV